MATNIDIQNYAGELNGSAAESQGNASNSYPRGNANDDYPVYKEFLEPSQDASRESAPEEVMEDSRAEGTQAQASEPQLSKQELNFRALREEVEQKNAEIERIRTEKDTEKRIYEQNIELYRANIANHAQKEPQKSNSLFEGMDKSEVPTVAEIEAAWSKRESGYRERLEEMQVAQTHSDYAEVLEKHLTPLIKEKPHLASLIQRADNKALAAYELGKMYQQLNTPKPVSAPQHVTPPAQAAQRMVENARKPGTLSSAGGQGALSKAEYYATMSDKEFMELAGKYVS